MDRKFGTIRDLAQATGLSVATVSRVMNGAENVSEKARTQVLEASSRLNYIPNPAARALTTKRSKTIAAIVPTIEHSVFAKYIAAIEQTLDAHNYSLVLAISNADKNLELKAARKLLGMGADAFILSGSDHHDELMGLFARRNTPFVFTSVWEPECDGPTIGYDNFELSRRAVNYLASRGHRHIAVVHGPLADSDRTRSRKAGAEDAASDVVDLHFYETELTATGGKEIVEAVIGSDSNCTAVLCFSDVLAQGVYFALQAASISIPEEISLMGFDNLDWSADVIPALTTINLPARRMGVEVATQLINHLEQGEKIQTTQLTGELVERQSVRTIPC